MKPTNSNHWTTDPEYIQLLNYLIKKTENVRSPMSLRSLAKEYKEKMGATQTTDGLFTRINKARKVIPHFQHIDIDAKVKLMFALSIPVNADFLKKLEDAVVEVDEKNRITLYKANDGSLELKGDHSVSAKVEIAKLESKRCHLKLIRKFLKNNENPDEDSKNEKETEMVKLLKFIREKCENVDSPFRHQQLSKDFISLFGVSQSSDTIRMRIRSYCTDIQKLDDLNTVTKVKQLFALSVPLDSDYLKELRKEAVVDVDKQNRITLYKANDGSLELKGDHSQSAKTRTALLESKGNYRMLIRDYFENKDNADKLTECKEKKEMGYLIEFITEKCENVDSPLSIYQMTKDFKIHSGIARPLETIRSRIKGYCRQIQSLGHLDTQTKVKQLFGLSASLDLNCLDELRKDAVVEVDEMNRITKYTANDNSLNLHGDHSLTAKRKLGWLVRRKNKNAAQNSCNTDGDESEESEEQDDYSDEDSDEYSSEEFDSEFDSDNENRQEEPDDLMDPSTGIDDLDYLTPVRRLSPPIEDSFSYDPSFERTENTEIREDEENDPGLTESLTKKTRYGRMSKKRHLDSESSFDVVNSRSSRAPVSSNSGSPKCAKKKKRGNEKEKSSSSSSQSSNSLIPIRRSSRNRPLPSFPSEPDDELGRHDPRVEEDPIDYDGPRIQEMEDFDYDPRENSVPEDFSINNHIEESVLEVAEERISNLVTQNAENRQNAAVPEPQSIVEPNLETQNVENRPEEVVPKPQPAEDNVSQNNENSIVKQESSPPPTDGNEFLSIKTHIRILESLLSIMTTFDTPALAEDQERIEKTIEKFESIGNEEERMRMNELRTSLMTCLLIVDRSAKKEIVKGEETTSLKEFLRVFISTLIPLKLKELDGFVSRLKYMVKEDNDKKFPTKKIQLALQPILEIITP